MVNHMATSSSMEAVISAPATPAPTATTASATTTTPTTQQQPQPCSSSSTTVLRKQLNKYFTPPVQLQDWKDMPRHLQFNPYVLKGYRPLQDVKGCVNSLFYLHNESINILTHGIPMVYILATVPAMLPWENEYRFLSWCHLFGAVAPWCGSFIYHLFMNLNYGEFTYYRLLQLDMLGIWVSQSFGALPMVVATAFCFNFFFRWLMILSYSMLSIWGLYKALTAGSPWQRRLCFSLPFAMRILLFVLRVVKIGGGNPLSIHHIILQDGVSVFGGAIGAMHIPEKWFPGSVDMYLNSHNIMHVLVVLAVYSMHQATVLDIQWMLNDGKCGANIALNATGSHIEL